MSISDIAHIRQKVDGSFEVQSIEEHSRNVAELAKDFMYEDSEGHKEIAYVAGLLHDFGKYRSDFQRYIMVSSGMDTTMSCALKAPHAIVGAIEAIRHYGAPDENAAEVLAFVISGHHRGLYDQNTMSQRLRMGDPRRWCDECEANAGSATSFDFPKLAYDPYDHQMTIRMIFSSLIDADRLDTERYMAPEISNEREGIRDHYDSLMSLRDKLREHTDAFSNAPDTPVNRSRGHFLDLCRQHGQSKEAGIYTLSLPTGAGKTLSSMAWALEMAIRNGHDRIIYVIPYTSIITQTADTFRKIFGEQNILEHHSEVVVDLEEEGVAEKLSRLQLLSENWDAPIVLTTNVQFFESLFAANPSKCRKVHNIANSVIVMDEAQALPDDFLSPILSSIDSLAESFHCSILLCTATQPIFGEDQSSDEYGDDTEYYDPLYIEGEVVPREEQYFAPFDRVHYHLEPLKVSSGELADRLCLPESVLCVVNSRKDATLVYQALVHKEGVDQSEVIHLSRMMCSAHLREKIDQIKERMDQGLPTKVISTQLIEAGVDLDFPEVWRAEAGLGSIIQAGGRCNREGLREKGEVYVFALTDGGKPFGAIAKGVEATSMTRSLQPKLLEDPTAPEVIKTYYEQYFQRITDFDTKRIRENLEVECNFETVAERFNLIDDSGTRSVLVPYASEGRKLSSKIQHGELLTKRDYHQLQEYSVSLRDRDYLALLKQGSIEEISRGRDEDREVLAVLTDAQCYDAQAGVVLGNHWLEEPLTK